MKSYLDIERILKLEKYYFSGELYLKIRDVASFIDIKQPFQLTADIKKRYGNSSILKGNITECFRDHGDTSRTVFVKAASLLDFLKHDESYSSDRTYKMKLCAVIKCELEQ